MPPSDSEDSLPRDFYHFLRLENPEMDLEINMTTEQEVLPPPAISNPEDPDFQAQVDFVFQAPAPPPPSAPTHSNDLRDIDTASGSRTRTYASLAPRALASRSVRGPDRAPNLFITPATIPPPVQPASSPFSEADSQPRPPGPINFYDRKHPGFVSDIISQTVGQIKPFEYESPTVITPRGPIILQDCLLPKNITGEVLSHLNVLKTQLDELQQQLGALPHNLVKKIDDDVDQIQATLKTLRRQTFSTFEDHYMVKTYNNCPSYLPTSPVEDQHHRIA